MVISDGKSSCEYDYTRPDDRLHSDLMDVELNGWKEYRVRSKRHDLDLNATSGHDPVDFGKLLTFKDFSLGHQEAGARATGHIKGILFNAISEEQTPYLQSLILISNAVLCLKKKNYTDR